MATVLYLTMKKPGPYDCLFDSMVVVIFNQLTGLLSAIQHLQKSQNFFALDFQKSVLKVKGGNHSLQYTAFENRIY